MRELTEIRTDIDRVDEKIAALLRERFALVMEVRDYKRARGMAVQQPGREAEVLERIAARMPSPDQAEAAREVYARIIAVSRGLQ